MMKEISVHIISISLLCGILVRVVTSYYMIVSYVHVSQVSPVAYNLLIRHASQKEMRHCARVN